MCSAFSHGQHSGDSSIDLSGCTFFGVLCAMLNAVSACNQARAYVGLAPLRIDEAVSPAVRS